ncbi:GNAT family N-acetyltransferase [Streptomyces sp. NBC_01262]|uniref:GNAT family N-acetyltransferase n=1 Tax=Streptomyces sp. NBC_01262 TaxID=2903803 RepID=UPI002E36CA09|nr:GNAT family N-acetyltransferase [Streptomyces sp. NBC_01262]
MSHAQLLTDAQALWAEVAAAPVAFPEQGISVVASPASRLCPPGWVGLVLLADSGIGTTPDQEAADTVRELLADYPPKGLYDRPEAAKALPATAMLGPTTLAYLAPERFHPAAGPAVEQLPVEHPDLRALENLCSPEERDEASIDELTSPVFAIGEGGEVVAAAGYVAWPRNTAHMAILTAPSARGRGLAKVAASSAVAHALAAHMLPQWRARVPASQRVARALGFTDLGVQISLKLA